MASTTTLPTTMFSNGQKVARITKDTPRTVPRKRRRRTTTSGAPDDCFTCARRQVKCDRRRPYCSQCLELGSQCSGYKTTLTWGVGVASRGKLRGLSLPISSSSPSRIQRPKQKSQVLQDRLALDIYPNHIDNRPKTSPMFYPSNNPSTSDKSSSVPAPFSGPVTDPTSYKHRTDHPQSTRLTSGRVTSHDGSHQPEDDGSSCISRSPVKTTVTNGTLQGFHSIPQPIHHSFIGKTPRMRYLISYYSEVIAPMMVTFDSPTNPYRAFVLELAKSSDTLQHAIAALSLSNLRQRRGLGMPTGRTLPSRKSSQAHRRMTDQFAEAFGPTTPEEQMKEEAFHQVMAVKSVNERLADPVQRCTDSLLATLLIFCLFQMCDTGVAAFEAQFAGVKKLLALREGMKSTKSDVTRWVTRMFTWFDTMVATVNDRDIQLDGSRLDLTTTGYEEWGLENLSGCSSSLFRAVSQLGRLNQLSQAKSVNLAGPINSPVSTAAVNSSRLHQHIPQPLYPDGSPTPSPAVDGTLPIDARTEFWREFRAVRQKLESWRLDIRTSSSLDSSGTQESRSSSSSSSSPLLHVSAANITDLSNISESFRYSALLYLERLAHPHVPSTHPRIQSLVYASLHYISAVQSDVFLLWPLFVTGSECTLESDRAIIRQRCVDIQKDSGFVNNLSCLKLLERIWQVEDSNAYSSSVAEGGSEETGDRYVMGGEAFRWRRIFDEEKGEAEYIVV